MNFENKFEMSRLVQNENNLQTIRIHKSEIKNIVFTDEEKEMSFKGEMYDIKDKSVDGDYIVFHCMNDKKEEALLSDLDKQVQNNIDTKSSSEKKQNMVSKNILKDYFISKKQNIILLSDKIIFASVICYPASDISLSLSVPPPKQA